MSIFKNTFSPFVKQQIDYRQRAVLGRTPKDIQYLNARNAWVRMSSSVNVNGTNELAKKYILQGGTLNLTNPTAAKLGDAKAKLKSGIGNTADSAYSNTSVSGIPYQRGIRPMPGITSMDIKSKSAYGSLREVIISFQCWDIQQLEDLEVLYMRPGYTVLIEWGWTPYLDAKGEYQSKFFDYYDIINKGTTDRSIIFKELYDKCKQYSGNYDAMFGYIRNYSWSARPDGGYDCQAVIISTGEIIESLKINYYLADIDKITNGKGLVDEFKTPLNNNSWEIYYRDYNILAGMWAELTYKVKEVYNANWTTYSGFNLNNINYKIIDLKGLSSINTDNATKNLSSDGLQVYVKLDKALELIEKHIIAKDELGNPLIKLSLESNKYDDTNTTGSLLCVAHPLQISIDPTVCLIKSPFWYSSKKIELSETFDQINDSHRRASLAADAFKKAYDENDDILVNYKDRNNLIIKGLAYLVSKDDITLLDTKYLQEIIGENISTLEQLLNEFSKYKPSIAFNFEEGLKLTFFPSIDAPIAKEIETQFKKIPGVLFSFDLIEANGDLKQNSIKISYEPSSVSAVNVKDVSRTLSDLKFLENLEEYFQDNIYSELGIIKNIYVNVNYLFQKSLDVNIEASDKKEKNEINLYAYLKRLISDIQVSIGNINNFEIHVDPIDNVARIIDINYTEKKIYEGLFELQVHNLKSIVRSYTLQSQIFPEQSSIIAIGAQAKGGQLGMQTNTLIDFNRGLTDRIILEKKGDQGDLEKKETDKTTISNGLTNIISAFQVFTTSNTPSKDAQSNFNKLISTGKNSLKDIITYFQGLTKSPGSNRNIIPTKFSFEMDGIGGLVIGHMFKLPKGVIPKGYRGEGVGTELGQIITGISHTVSNGDWMTKVDTLNVVLSTDSENKFKDSYLTDILISGPATGVTITATAGIPVGPPAPTVPPPPSTSSTIQETNAQKLTRRLAEIGVTVKSGQLDENGDISAKLVDPAFEILSKIKKLGDTKYSGVAKIKVTAGNDKFHQNKKDKNKPTQHPLGIALDFVLEPEPKFDIINGVKTYNQNPRTSLAWAYVKEIENILIEAVKNNKISSYINEYERPSNDATGGHFHFVV